MSDTKFVCFNSHPYSKLYNLKITKDKMRKAIIDAGFDSRMSINKFYHLKFRINRKEFTGQTILRNFGNKKRSTENAVSFLKSIGLDYTPNNSEFSDFDFTDPKQLRFVLLRSKIDFRICSYQRFLKSNITLCKKKITGHRLLKEYQIVLSQKNIAKFKNPYIPSKRGYIDMLSRAGLSNNFYNSISDKFILRKILESANFDFENKRFGVVDFLKMKFNSYYYSIDKRNKGVFTGQSLLRHYFMDKVNYRMEQILTMLKDAGYDVSHMELINRHNQDDPFKFINHKIAKEILSSCTQKVNWCKVKVKEFMNLRFNSKYFTGTGFTLMKKLGTINSIAMRKLLSLAGFNNTPKFFIKRIKNK